MVSIQTTISFVIIALMLGIIAGKIWHHIDLIINNRLK
jgi:hypothetical protein